jgi:uncharacterized protein involved in tolerance to divalent cations
MKEQWRQEMQQKMAGYKRPAPEVSWDELSKALAGNRRKAKEAQMWTRRIAAAVVAIVAVTAGYLAFDQQEDSIINNNKVEAVVKHEKTEPQQLQQKTRNIDTENAKPRLLAMTVRESSDEFQDVQSEESQKVSETDSQETPVVSQEESVVSQEESPVSQQDKSQMNHDTPKRQTLDNPSDAYRPKVSSNRLMAKVYISNGVLAGNSFDDDLLRDRYNAPKPGPVSDPVSEQDKTSKNDNNVVIDDAHHRLPVRFGLSLRYCLNDKWSIEGGLTYTRLNADYDRVQNGSRKKLEQTLSYIGLPVNANYQLWGSRYFNLYVSGGGMAEMMVKGSLRNDRSTESVSEHPLQFSVNGAMGAEVNLSRFLSIYAEPGVGYYFNNGSSIPTYYQEHPFSFNLNIGLRFNIK